MKFAREMGRPLVATADVHYLRREDHHHHAALLCVQTKSTLAAPKLSFDTNEFYLKSSEEIAQSFSDLPEALASTVEIADRCDVSIELGSQLIPRFETPNGGAGGRVPARAGRRRAAAALRRPGPGRCARARRAGAGRDRQHGLQRLLPDRPRLRRLRQAVTASRSARAAARRPARSSPTAWRSRTSTRSATACCSSAS